jgi:hypothetical protein
MWGPSCYKLDQDQPTLSEKKFSCCKTFSLSVMHSTVHLSWVACVTVLIFGGCGSSEKYITVVNEASGIELTSRYVTSSRSLKIKAPSIGLKYFIGLPNSISRINKAKIGLNAKKFDFHNLENQRYSYWIEKLTGKKPGESSEKCTGIKKEMKGTSNSGDPLTLFILQSTDGELRITVDHHPTNEGSTESTPAEPDFVVISYSQGQPICITQWAADEALWDEANSLLEMREAFLKQLSEGNNAPTYQIGSKLKRSNPSSKIQSDENQA